ncbi:peptidoglycan DD-metalloendopeptidase family protein [Psychroserpens ponticola]|uniref:Peptidoglycan DD-metalloendopeptidase family protein n=1 Tax=Psychroserpens ponticola TaxID=2932268 RepID=A0ABY7RWZ1_9FLAO|nr:peptidoglycan DD-metalloendopeptidase family protein [Psychroserpens ponticola]WCO01597.1 peptidoglycan DD-metalloendopeptidase family protein [Psychroserpens ponticola]
MKSKITLSLFAILFAVISYSQSPNSQVGGGEFVFNSAKKPCITPAQRSEMIKNVQTNIENLQRKNQLTFSEQRRGNHPLFIWPIQKANDVSYNEVYSVFNYVDHDTGFPNQIEDYTCGARTYDTTAGYNHEGTDIVTWPFMWKMMDDDGVEVIAAAPGQIIVKHDGEFDRSCDASAPMGDWNLIIVQHGDGSVAAYGHMKNGSLTSKEVGDMVSAGEFLGIVGSSGISDFPHLHFEVLSDATFTEIIDPYVGVCNPTSVDSWWQSQRPYNDPGINAVLTHTADPIFPECPTAEITNESNQFDVNDEVFLAIYLKDQTAGSSVNLRVIKPDDTVLFDWIHDLTANYYTSWWRWNLFPDVAGEWKWEATYAGETVTHTFNVNDPLSIDENDFNQTSVYPNPFNDVIHILSPTKIANANLVDVLGKTVLSLKGSSEGITTIDLSSLSNGMYFLMLESDVNEKKTIKLIKE